MYNAEADLVSAMDLPIGSKMLRWNLTLFVACCLVLFVRPLARGQESGQSTSPAPADVKAAAARAVQFYTKNVALNGGYVYYYSLDLKRRLGEGPAAATEVWVQPPGTPTVGLSFAKLYEATGDRTFLDAATDAALVLVYGQLNSGGWTNKIDLAPALKGLPFSGGKRRLDGHSSLDDGQTPAALQLLLRVDRLHAFRHQAIHQAAERGLQSLLLAQYPNGGFPQVWTTPVPRRSVVPASYPTLDWRTEGRIKTYWNEYTLNDNVCGNVADTLVLAHQTYGGDRYLAALQRLGDFLLLAQMPMPQPAWCQQYNEQMQPIWARAFEPPAIAADESQEVIDTLLKIASTTGDPRFLKPIPAALVYLDSSLLPDGQLARYYELETNRPLYMERRGRAYQLTYDDANLPDHYGWKWPSRGEELREKLVRLQADITSPADTAKSEDQAKSNELISKVLADLDSQGRWISQYDGRRLVGQPKFGIGESYLSSEVFCRNLDICSDYLSL